MDDEKYRLLCDNPPLPCPRASHPCPSTQLAPPQSPPPLNSTNSTLVIGSSMVRDLYIPPSPSGPSKVYLVPRSVTSCTNSQAYSPVTLMSTISLCMWAQMTSERC
ncbi:hypothetical protein UPYG_G00030220 [Umbra pygmaea]|uniref:Uncharacterized protein n=1 Tax=Umbra pygmaea TaxID=75934 RepID=A0ABD0XMK4_UMBPY